MCAPCTKSNMTCICACKCSSNSYNNITRYIGIIEYLSGAMLVIFICSRVLILVSYKTYMPWCDKNPNEVFESKLIHVPHNIQYQLE